MAINELCTTNGRAFNVKYGREKHIQRRLCIASLCGRMSVVQKYAHQAKYRVLTRLRAELIEKTRAIAMFNSDSDVHG